MRSSTNPINVFHPDYLDRLSHRDRSGSTFSEAEYAGPWTVREHEGGFAVLREADSGDGTPDAVFTERTALLVAAVYQTMGREPRFQVTNAEDGPGADVLALVSGKLAKVGWLRHMHLELVEALSVVEWLLRSPASLPVVLEAASYEVLPMPRRSSPSAAGRHLTTTAPRLARFGPVQLQ